MRAPLSAVLFLSFAASAATFTARVVRDGAPVSGAQVKVFVEPRRPLAGCKRSSYDEFLGTCLCPSEQEAFTKRALAGLEGTQPIATATTGADGAFSLTVGGDGPFPTRVLSADGAWAATLTLSGETKDIVLVPSVVTRVRLTGITAGAVAYLVDATGEITRLERHDAEWASPPMPPGSSDLVIVAPGAVASRRSMYDGRPMGQPRMDEDLFTVTVTGPLRVEGQVTERGQPVAGAEVVADPDTCAITMKTDSSGVFTFTSPTSPPFITPLIARAGGRVAKGYGSSDRVAELVLKPAARLELTFVDQKGARVPGVEVWLEGQEGSNRRSPPSDAQGRWTMGELVEGAVQLRLDGTLVLMSEPKLSLKGVTKVRAVVARGVSLGGIVLDAKGKPVPDVYVSAFYGEALQTQVSEAMKDALRSVGRSTDARGAFELKGLIPGEYELVAKSQALGEGTAIATAPGRTEIKIIAPYFLEGDVVDAAGKPVDKAWLSIHRKSEPNNSYGTSTGPDGHFRYAFKAPGVFEVTASRGSRGAAEGKLQLAEIPGSALKFVLGEQAQLTGVVVDASGAPVAGVLVQAIPSSMPQLVMARMQRRPSMDPVFLVGQAKMMRMYAEAISAKDGSFSLALGTAAVVFAVGEGVAAEPVDAKPAVPLRLVVSARARATGRVLDWNGRPVESFRVNEKHFNSTGGKFEISLPARGEAQLRFDGALAPYETRTVQVPELPTEVSLGDIQLKRAFTVSGKVTDAAGKPITPPPYLDTKGGAFDSSGLQADGTFTLKRVPEGKLTLTASCNDYAPAGAMVDVKQGMAEVILKLEKTASLEITVLQKGEPAEGISVEASGPPIPMSINKRIHTTASDGRVKLEQLSPGSWTVKVGREAGPTRTIKLEPGQQAKLELAVSSP